MVFYFCLTDIIQQCYSQSMQLTRHTKEAVEYLKRIGYKKYFSKDGVWCMTYRNIHYPDNKVVLQIGDCEGIFLTRSVSKNNLTKRRIYEMARQSKKAAEIAAKATETASVKEQTKTRKRKVTKPVMEASMEVTTKKRKKKTSSNSTVKVPDTGVRQGMGYFIFEVANQLSERTGKKASREAVETAVLKKTQEYSKEQIAGRYSKWSRRYEQLNA